MQSPPCTKKKSVSTAWEMAGNAGQQSGLPWPRPAADGTSVGTSPTNYSRVWGFLRTCYTAAAPVYSTGKVFGHHEIDSMEMHVRWLRFPEGWSVNLGGKGGGRSDFALFFPQAHPRSYNMQLYATLRRCCEFGQQLLWGLRGHSR